MQFIISRTEPPLLPTPTKRYGTPCRRYCPRVLCNAAPREGSVPVPGRVWQPVRKRGDVRYGPLLGSSCYLTTCAHSPGVLPEGQNSPQKVKYELYAEGVRARTISGY